MEATVISETTTEEVDLWQYIRVLMKRKWSILIIFLAATVTSYLVSSRMTPIYEATSTVLVKQEMGGQELPFLADFSGLGRNATQNYVEILKSRSLLERVLARIGWNIPTDSGEFEALRSSISIQPVQGTDTIRITVQSEDPRRAMILANAMVDVFIEQNQLTNQEAARSAKEFISAQLKVAEGRLRLAEDALLAYKLNQRVVEPSEEVKAQIEKIVSLQKLQAETEVGIQQAASELAQIRKEIGAQDPMLVASRTVTTNPLIQEYKAKLSDLEAQLAGAREKYTDKHPTVLSLKAEIAEIRDRLSSEVARIVSAETTSPNPVHQALLQKLAEAQAELVGLEARKAALEKLVATNEAAMANFPRKEMDLARLTREQRVAEEIYVMLLTKYEEMRITEAMKVANIQRLDDARLPTRPVKPRKMLNTLIAGFLGLFVGVGVAFLIEFLDTSIKSVDELEEILGSPVIGMIPSMDAIVRRRRRKRRHTGSTDAGTEVQT